MDGERRRERQRDWEGREIYKQTGKEREEERDKVREKRKARRRQTDWQTDRETDRESETNKKEREREREWKTEGGRKLVDGLFACFALFCIRRINPFSGHLTPTKEILVWFGFMSYQTLLVIQYHIHFYTYQQFYFKQFSLE